MSKVVGIDLGTTNSLVAPRRRRGLPAVIRDGDWRAARCRRSCTAAADGSLLVGRAAQKRLAADEPRRHRRVPPSGSSGRGVDRHQRAIPRDAPVQGQLVGDGLPDLDRGARSVGAGDLPRSEPSSCARAETARSEAFFAAEAALGGPEVDRAVITVPAYFDDSSAKRRRTPDDSPVWRSCGW